MYRTWTLVAALAVAQVTGQTGAPTTYRSTIESEPGFFCRPGDNDGTVLSRNCETLVVALNSRLGTDFRCAGWRNHHLSFNSKEL